MYGSVFSQLFLMIALWQYPITTAAAATPIIRTGIPTCWEDHTRFTPVTFRDCVSVINREIIKDHDPNKPLKFSKDPSVHPDIQLPKYWVRDGVNCGIAVDLASESEGYDVTTLRDIKDAALAIAYECVIKPPHAGGFVELGRHRKLGVLISGARSLGDWQNETIADEWA